jgi:hypothetical protein
MSEAVGFIRQIKGFSHFRELDGLIRKLEDRDYSQKKYQKAALASLGMTGLKLSQTGPSLRSG